MIDLAALLDAVERRVVNKTRDGGTAYAATMSYPLKASREKLWEAITDPDILPFWFAPVHGELEEKGRFKVEGNAGGTITYCDPYRSLSMTWELDDSISWLDIDISSNGVGSTRLTLTHTSKASPHWETYGPGATGLGWECALMGLVHYLADPAAAKLDEAFMTQPASKNYFRQSASKWADAAVIAGETKEQAKAAARNTANFYTGTTK